MASNDCGKGYFSNTTEMTSDLGKPVPRSLYYKPGNQVVCQCNGSADAVKACIGKTAGFNQGLDVVPARNKCRDVAQKRL